MITVKGSLGLQRRINDKPFVGLHVPIIIDYNDLFPQHLCSCCFDF